LKVQSSIIENKYLRVRSINIGACLYEVYDKQKKINLILNLGSKKNYSNKNFYVGATCGRYAGRISNSRFKIKKKIYKLDGNEGRNTLHGGKIGFDRLEWKIHHHSKTKIIYQLLSKNLDQGFPGDLNSQCIFEIKNKSLFIKYQYKSNKLTTIINNTKYKNRKIDFLNVDLEGADFEALKSLDFNIYRPKLICVEIYDEDIEKSNINIFLENLKYTRKWSATFSHLYTDNLFDFN